MKAVIMAGGEGKRLRPLTCTLPKPKAPILGKPVIFYALEKLTNLGIDGTVLTLGYKASEIISLFPDGEYNDIPIETVVEELPLGTAGGVKNALPDPEETVLVLSGDAFFDFDLKDAYEFHKANKNDVTVICKYVDDPREYGIVNVDSESRVIDFSEKPGWENAFSNFANTGIYFLEPSAVSDIPENTAFDFAKDLFPKLLAKNYKIGAYKSTDYWCDIGDIDSFKQVQFDILDGKTSYKPPHVAEGVFSESPVPKGEYIIVPPVFFGKNVQIEEGAVIGPYAVISDGSLISGGSKIRNSVLLSNVYVSSNCNINGALLCEGVSVKHGAEIFEGATVGCDSVIGEAALISAGVGVWPKKTVQNGEVVRDNIKYSQKESKTFMLSGFMSGDFGVELTPEKSAKLGAALGTLFENIRIGVGIDGEANSLALKCGMLGGLISTGAKSFDFGKCFNAQMFYYSSFCDLDTAVFISGGNEGASVSIYENGGIPLSREHLRSLEMIMKQNEFNRCSGGDCRSVSVMSSMEQMYINEAVRQFEGDFADFETSAFSSNKLITDCVNEGLKKIGCTLDGDDLIFKINAEGTRLTVIENSVSFIHEKVLAVVAYDEMKNGNDIALPWEAPQIITSLAKNIGRRVYRYSENSSCEARLLGIGSKQLWARDGVFLMFKLLSVMAKSEKTLEKLVFELPEFYVAKKVMEIDASPAVISKTLLDGDFEKSENGGIILTRNTGSARVKSNSDGKALRIIAEAVSVEAARELCAEAERLIGNVTIDKGEL